ncbi:hypothetical protein [Krasilnikovia sp. MM14-A1259]|uniref:hypothetical protein n=1 Tax=Krasilnikovia sp. MM14-A1259 TaxID=3373539 RepID=UPI00399CBCC1
MPRPAAAGEPGIGIGATEPGSGADDAAPVRAGGVVSPADPRGAAGSTGGVAPELAGPVVAAGDTGRPGAGSGDLGTSDVADVPEPGVIPAKPVVGADHAVSEAAVSARPEVDGRPASAGPNGKAVADPAVVGEVDPFGCGFMGSPFVAGR